MSSSSNGSADQVRQNLETLSAAVREMTPYGALPVPAVPQRFNLLARPVLDGCRICGLPGHHSDKNSNASACRIAIISLIGFWNDVTNPVSFLYRYSGRFKQAIAENEPTYEMRNNDGPVKGGDIEVVLVDHLTKNYLKFQAFWQKIRPLAHALLAEPELMWFVSVSMTLDGFLLNRLSRKFMTRQWEVQS